MNGQDGSSSLVGMSFVKLNVTNYRLWAMRMTDYLQREGLWNLVNGREQVLEKPEQKEKEKDVKEYEKYLEKYEKQELRMQKACGTRRMAMTDAIAIRYYDEQDWTTASSIWLDAHASYQTSTNYDSNHLQQKLYKSTLEESGTVLKFINHIQELRDKLVMGGQSPSYAHLIFHTLEGLPKTPELKTWVMVTKAALLDQNSLTAFKELKELLLAYEAELRRERSLLPDQALYTKGKRSNLRRQESASPTTSSTSRIRGKSQSPNSFSGICHGCGKKGHKKAECWQDRNNTTASGG